MQMNAHSQISESFQQLMRFENLHTDRIKKFKASKYYDDISQAFINQGLWTIAASM